MLLVFSKVSQAVFSLRDLFRDPLQAPSEVSNECPSTYELFHCFTVTLSPNFLTLFTFKFPSLCSPPMVEEEKERRDEGRGEITGKRNRKQRA